MKFKKCTITATPLNPFSFAFNFNSANFHYGTDFIEILFSQCLNICSFVRISRPPDLIFLACSGNLSKREPRCVEFIFQEFRPNSSEQDF